MAASQVKVNQTQGCSANDATTEQTGLVAPFAYAEALTRICKHSAACCGKSQLHL